MLLKNRVKNRIGVIALAGVMLASAGCNGESLSPVQPTPTAVPIIGTDVISTPTEMPKSAPYGVMVKINHEAGTELSGEEFKSGYEGNITIIQGPTKDELKTIGTFNGVIDCDGRTVPVTIVTVDTTAPIINVRDIEINEGDTISYKRDVEVWDYADDNPSLEIFKDAVDVNKAGDYKVVYRASDASGNTSEATITVHVKGLETEIERLVNTRADEVIASVCKAGMTNLEKAYAVFQWCHNNLTYKGDEVEQTYYEAAYAGLYKNAGDCYVSYVLLDVLYKRMGFETRMLERIGGTSDHYWNYVNYGDGWYHCDCIKRRTGNKAYDGYWCFMQTDAQVQEYNVLRGDGMPNCYTYDTTKVPSCSTYKFYDGNTHEFIKDTEAPVISGVTDIHIRPGESIAYKKNVVVTDNSGEDITVRVNNSGVDTKKIGIYPITYYAEDSAGNYTEVAAKVFVSEVSEEMLEVVADNLLSTIITPDMSQKDRAYAVYSWIAYHVAYVDMESGVDPIKAAYDGITKYKGDCYVFGHMAQYLLTRAGVESILVTKEPSNGVDHFWNIINIDGKWYHFDSTPWWDKAQIFMWTDSQLYKYSIRPAHGEGYYPTHPYDKSKYPEVVQ